MNDTTLAGASALVTGADTQFGKAIAQTLADAGVRLALHVNDAEQVRSIRQRFDADICIAGPADDESVVGKAVQRIAENSGHLNILVCAHAQPNSSSLFDKQHFWPTVHQHLTGSFLFARESAHLMKRAPWARMVLLSSGWANGGNGLSALASASGGINILTKTLARELGPYDISVNAIAPALIDGEWLACDASALNLTIDELRHQAARLIPAGQLGSATELAESVRLLCEPGLGAAVAQTLQCSGGFFRLRT